MCIRRGSASCARCSRHYKIRKLELVARERVSHRGEDLEKISSHSGTSVYLGVPRIDDRNRPRKDIAPVEGTFRERKGSSDPSGFN